MPNRENYIHDNNLVRQNIETLAREEWGKLLSCLIARLGDFQLAEDALQDSFEVALDHWNRKGLPQSPVGWLLKVAGRKAIDRIRRDANFRKKQAEYTHLMELDLPNAQEDEEMQEIPDERLRLIFTCCHPALDEKSRLALTLRTLGGLKTGEIAKAFLDSEDAMAQRIVRAKRKIKVTAIPFIVPDPDQWNERLATVLGVLYLIFNEGYFSTGQENQLRNELSNEAIRLTGIVLRLIPGEAEVEGLMALMLLHDSRRRARQTDAGDIVALEDQNRALWNEKKISEGLGYLTLALGKGKPGPFQIQAAISAVHAQALSHEETDWHEIVGLYDVLYQFQANPIIALNRSVAISYAENPKTALCELESLATILKDYQPYYAAKADFHRRCGEIKLAEISYRSAIDLSHQKDTKAFLERRLGEMLRAASD